MTILVSDSFNRANNTTSLGSTDNFYGGSLGQKAWQVSTSNGVGKYGISSNQAYCVTATSPNGHNVAYVDVGVSNFWAQTTFSTLDDANGGGPKISLRIKDSDNMINVQVMTTGILVYYYSSGSSTNLPNQYSGTIANGDVIKVHANGTAIDVYRNGTLVCSNTTSFNQTLTTVGIMAYNYPTARFDDFVVADADFTITHDVAPAGPLAVSSTTKSLSSAKGNVVVTTPPTYLSLNGTSDYIQTPTLTFDRMEIYARIDSSFQGTGSRFIFDDRGNTGVDDNGALYSGTFDNGLLTPADSFTQNGIVITSNTQVAVNQFVTIGMIRASASTFSVIGASQALASFGKLDVVSVKYWNAGVLTASYDLTKGNVTDQSGNGNNATLSGGTWVTDSNFIKANSKAASSSTAKGSVTVTGVKSVSGKAVSASSAKGNVVVSGKASYLSLNGSTDYISIPSMTVTDVYINFEYPAATNAYNLIYEAGTGSSAKGVLWHSDHFASESTIVTIDPPIDTAETANTMINLHASDTAWTNTATIGKGDAGFTTGDGTAALNMPMSVYDVKFYNGATLVAHYDMTTGTVNDQSGNGYNATLVGGTWVGSSVLVSSTVTSHSSGKVTVANNGVLLVSSTVTGHSSGKATASKLSGLPTVNKTVLVIMENHSQSEIIGNASAPYMNSLANNYANFTAFSAIEHPSQPNYLDIFSGSNQGITDDNFVTAYSINAPNLYTVLNAAGKKVYSYMESMSSVGSTEQDGTLYAARHNPASKFSNVPPSTNMPFSGYWPSSDFSSLPEISIVVPNLQNDIHDGTIQQGDTWLQTNIDPYLQWAKNNDSLLIIVFDEDDTNTNAPNTVPFILAGPMVKQVANSTHYDHYSLLRTMIDLYGGQSYPANSMSATSISGVWQTGISSTISSKSGSTVNVSITHQVASKSISTSHETANTVVTHNVSSKSISTSHETANTTLHTQVSASIASHSAVGASNVGRESAVAGSTKSLSTAVANVSVTRHIASTVKSLSGYVNTASTTKPISGHTQSTSTGSAKVAVRKAVSGSVVSVSSVQNASVGGNTATSGRAMSRSSAIANVSVSRPISSVVKSSSDKKADSSVAKFISSKATSNSATKVVVYTSKSVSGSVSSMSSQNNNVLPIQFIEGRAISYSQGQGGMAVATYVSGRVVSRSKDSNTALVSRELASLAISKSAYTARVIHYAPNTIHQKVSVTVKLTTSVDIQLSLQGGD